ncbi:conserved hypothetical protein [Talaromyces stipitatus ATCC 10500]|uniref:Ribosomal protein S21 n=1 Tax=Talaromyces stipitatus (strain ATCC 10500 / CBS 375.48 / QM 6759 / NRRL 1006) TaxID=441959 RepID=B8MC80_TALSN|nr:uncharacterized protein TSTA_122580 [Talaromyces stipitatus ATCC 10500]EED18526.1 conserved hypothetical protein [Talaromyces stipitatus ATCC 10500]
MAVQSSLARCLRASPSTLIRPMSLPIRGGQFFQFSQRSGYATNDSADRKPSSNSSESQPTKKSSIFDGMNTTSSTTTTALRENVQYVTQPVPHPRATREFVKSPSSSSAADRAHRGLEQQLDNLLSRRAAPSRQQTSAAAAAAASVVGSIDQADPITPPRFRTVPMKLGTKLGRQVFVSNDRGVDVAAAIRMVQINCAVNGVRRQANLQKFHVRRGQRRKDLRSQRWRKLFKFSFDETVKKIQRMRDQGW